MDCVQSKIYNCLEKECDSGYECCSEKVPKGKPTFGMCVRQGQCDDTRGIPVKSCRDGAGKTKALATISTENFTVWADEGYGAKACGCRHALWIILLIIAVLVIALLFYLKSRKVL